MRVIVAEAPSTCFYCETPFDLEDHLSPHYATLDHKVPQSRGGGNDMTNLVWACRKCNRAKSDRTDVEFFEWLKSGCQSEATQDRLLSMRVNDDFLSMVDEWRRQQPDIPTRAVAIRRMVEIAAKGAR